jgi:hypothetical protein
MFLHAWRLQINHPVSQHQLQLEAKLPQNLYLTEFKQLGVELSTHRWDAGAQ